MSDEPTRFQQPITAEPLNPYAPSANVAITSPESTEAESIRRKYLSHEASVKSIALLYGIGAVFLIPIGLATVVGGIAIAIQDDGIAEGAVEGVVVTLAGVFYVCIGLFQAYTAYGLRRLSNGGRIGGIVLSVFGLIGFPIGTLISAYILYLLISAKGKVVFSEPYRQVIAQTPHIKYKTSIVVWVFLGILLLIIGLAVLAAIFAA